MLRFNPNCKIYDRDGSYFISNHNTGRYYQVNVQQHKYIVTHFLGPDTDSGSQSEMPRNDRFEQVLISKGILIEGEKIISNNITFEKRIVYSDIFHFRFPLLNPNLFCEKILYKGRFIFNRYVAALLFIFIFIGTFSVFIDWKNVLIPDNHLNVALYFLMIYLSSILLSIGHELSHALLCTKYGGHVRDMGIAFIYFSPCFYCNISDSYLFKEKYKRVMVALIGIVYDIIITLIALILFHYLLKIPRVYSIEFMRFSAIMILYELNPLFKHDGYYVLTELVSVYNLREKAFYMLRKIGTFSFSEIRNNGVLFSYGLLSFVYLIFHLYVVGRSAVIVAQLFI